MFKLNLEQVFNIENEKLELDHSLDLSEVVISEEHPFKTPVTVKGYIMNVAQVVFMDAEINAEYYSLCNRCAEPVVKKLTVPMAHTFVTELNNSEDNDEFIVIPDMILDIDELMTEDVMLNVPSKVLCREDCLGLCPHCGKNLNDGPCNCKKEVDPRLADLLMLLDDDDSDEQ